MHQTQTQTPPHPTPTNPPDHMQLSGYLTPIVILKMGEVFSGARDIMKWLGDCARVSVCGVGEWQNCVQLSCFFYQTIDRLFRHNAAPAVSNDV